MSGLVRLLSLLFLCFTSICRNASCNYDQRREEIIANERHMAVGGKVKLTKEESIISEKLVEFKRSEIEHFEKPVTFPQLKSKLNESKVLNFFMKDLPKGASLHTHILAAASLDYLIRNITYRENLYACDNFTGNRFKLKFFEKPNGDCNWRSVRELRSTNKNYDAYLEEKLSIDSPKTSKEAAQKLSSYFTAVFDMLTYRPVFEDYLYQSLKELHEDKVIYAEFRGVLMELYELNGTVWDPMTSLGSQNTVHTFVVDSNGKFLGAKYIFAVYRKISREKLLEYKAQLNEAIMRYPHFIAGFDLIGHEDAGWPLKKFTKDLMNPNVAYYFHAGETNWYGNDADYNILDAILLGAKRLGHAFSLAKHPRLMQMVKQEHIGLEVAPISNQMLGLISDFRNHPGAVYIAYGLPVIICNDDPALSNSKSLLYDWYIVYMTMTNRNAGLETLKEFALNSLYHSSLNGPEKTRALKMFEDQWQHYVQHLTRIFAAILWMSKM